MNEPKTFLNAILECSAALIKIEKGNFEGTLKSLMSVNYIIDVHAIDIDEDDDLSHHFYMAIEGCREHSDPISIFKHIEKFKNRLIALKDEI